MELRSPQEVTALRDVAYVLCYGHFPKSDGVTSDSTLWNRSKTLNIHGTKPTSSLASGSSSKDEGNPFSEDDGNPFPEEDSDHSPTVDSNNHFGDDEAKPEHSIRLDEDPNPLGDNASNKPRTEDSGPAGVEDHGKESEDVAKLPSSMAIEDPTPSAATTAENVPQLTGNFSVVTTSQPPIQLATIKMQSLLQYPLGDTSTLAAKLLTNARHASRTHAKEVVAEAFNITRIDLNRLVDETYRTKETPGVELHLEDIRTEGLPVTPAQGSYPIIFLRAILGKNQYCTSFSSTSASNTIHQGFSLEIQNMYNDFLIMEVWSADKLPEEELQSPYRKDKLSRLITGSIRRKKNDVSNRISKLGKSPKESKTEIAIIVSEPAEQTLHEELHHSPDSTSDEKDESSQPAKDAVDSNILQNGVAADDDLNKYIDKSDSVSISSEHSINPYMTSTPRGRSSSFQHSEATNAGSCSSTETSLKKGKGFRSSFKKSSFAKAFTRSSQNVHEDSLSPNQSGKALDTISIQSGCSDISSYENVDGETPDTSREISKAKLNREASKSTLSLASITSLTRRKLSIKFSLPKAKGKSIRGNKNEVSDAASPSGEAEHQQTSQSQNETPNKSDLVDGASHGKSSMSSTNPHILSTTGFQSSFKKLLNPRPMRQFKHIMGVNGDIGSIQEENQEDTNSVKPKEPNNPADIQAYLSSIEKGHLQAELLASTKIPLKGIVGIWEKEEWFPMVLENVILDEPPAVRESKKSSQQGKSRTKQVREKRAKVLCRMHVRLTMPQPMSDLHNCAYDTYHFSFSKLINMQIQSIPDLTNYKGSVGVVGDIILQQLFFFSRVGVGHKKLAEWLVLSNKKSSDSVLLFPLLKGVKSGLKNGEYNTTQRGTFVKSLSKWVRYIIPAEFETLHMSFPAYSQVLDPPRLEYFLRCFREIEENDELQKPFEREMNTISFPGLTDQLKGALAKHAEMWINALNKEPALQATDANIEVTGASPEDAHWHDDLRRAATLTKPIHDFLFISVQTYQPIFMVEMSIDYMYWVMPKFLTAALHLINKTKHFTSVNIRKLPEGYVSSALQASWKISNNLSDINRIGVKNGVPVHLIEQEYRTAFSMTVLQWITLSEMLSLEEIESDILQDEFTAVDSNKGYSRSALSMIDLLKAIMNRLEGLCWPGGIQPGKNTLIRIARHIFSLVTEYKKKVIHAYNTRGGHTDRIPTQACVVVRNIEHVCDEARTQLSHLAAWAEKELNIKEELQADETAEGNELQPDGRSQKLQSLIDDAAEKLLHKCLPRLEELLNQAVIRASPEYLIENLQIALQPIEDKLYFAEPLLYALWYRLIQHTTCLKDKFSLGHWRKDLQQLQKILNALYVFLTDSQQIGFPLPKDSVQDYEKLNHELYLLGASSSGLVAQYYHERYNNDQCKEESAKSQNIIVTYVAFSKDGLKVHILQSPGNQHQRGVLLKVRVEPVDWFPHVLPQKTRQVKGDVAVFDEVLSFPEVQNHGPPDEIAENNGIRGALVFQVRTPRLFGGSYVHHEAILPLEFVPRSEKDKMFPTQYRLPLTRPWSFTNYQPLETLKTRLQDKSAMDFLKAMHARWEGTDESSIDQDNLKVNSNFKRAGSSRFSTRSSRKSSVKSLPVK